MSLTYVLDEGGPVKTANLVSLLRGVLIVPIVGLLISSRPTMALEI